jgi:hypothetical protein
MSFHLYRTSTDSINNNSLTNFCVILDLDATLISTQDNLDGCKNLDIMKNPNLIDIKRRCYFLKLADNDKNNIKYDLWWGIKRPHIEEFLLFCFNYFRLVIVWSAGEKIYVDAIVDNIFKDLRKPHLVWTKNEIVFDKDDNGLKPLIKMVNSDYNSHNILKLENMIIIDDNDTTFVKNKKNALHIPPFDPECTIESFREPDTSLLQIKYWLLLPHVKNADDVTKLDMTTIFDYNYEDYKNVANSYENY